MSFSSQVEIGQKVAMPNDPTSKPAALIALMGWALTAALTLVWSPEGVLPGLALSLLRLAAIAQGLRAAFTAAGLVPPGLMKE